MNTDAILTKRQEQIAGLIATGHAQKEVADILGISIRTVENIMRETYKKVEVHKASELTGFYLCNFLGLDYNEIRKKIIETIVMTVVVMLSIIPNYNIRRNNIRNARTSGRYCHYSRGRRTETAYNL
ncbi:MAG: helix-turn-helix transcriptional regulator [Bacteroidales bacterium]|jgi:DNA-binding CsgD family transcriptional regulator|nr:helix-turn-helix transcriptional regulator [Bacteroidales bacterium]